MGLKIHIEGRNDREHNWPLLLIGVIISLVGLLLAVTGVAGLWSRYDLVIVPQEGVLVRLLGLFMLVEGVHVAYKAYHNHD